MKKKTGKQKTDLVVIVNVKKLIIFGILVAMSVLAIFSGIHAVKGIMKVRRIEVTGISQYENQEIVNACGVRLGEYLYRLDEEELEERILRECPYLESVRVDQSFPTTLRIYVEGKTGQWYIEVAGETKYALDKDLKVIGETQKTQGMTKLILPDLKNVIAGETPKFASSETELKKTLEIVSAIRESSFKTKITEVDLRSRWNIVLGVEGGFTVKMGDMSNFDSKLRAVEAVLKEERIQTSGGGEIYVSESGEVTFRGTKDTNEE